MKPGPDGNLYIGSIWGDEVLRFNLVTGANVGPDPYLVDSEPSGLGWDNAGNLYVSNRNTFQIRRFTPSGSPMTTRTFSAAPMGASLGPDGHIYFTVGAAIQRWNTTTDTTSVFVSNAYPTSTPTQAAAVNWGPDGNLYIVDYDNSKIRVYNGSGTLVRDITTSVRQPCCVAFMTCVDSDFGDLPAPYPTLMAANGPRHMLGSPRLGTSADMDGEGQPNASATGDDTDADGDDEDGVTIPTLTAGSTATVVINSSGIGKVNAFFDWNNDGDFLDASEAISELSVAAGNNNLTVSVPSTAVGG
jgi:hypothetical protein